MKLERLTALPNKRTFTIKPIKEFRDKWKIPGKSLDLFPYPFERDALEVLKETEDNSIFYIDYDPPYSQRQLKEVYHNIGFHYEMNSGFWRKMEVEIFRILAHKGRVLRCGWNSKQIPGLEILDGITVYHGGQHNDTIVTIQEKRQVTVRGKR